MIHTYCVTQHTHNQSHRFKVHIRFSPWPGSVTPSLCCERPIRGKKKTTSLCCCVPFRNKSWKNLSVFHFLILDRHQQLILNLYIPFTQLCKASVWNTRMQQSAAVRSPLTPTLLHLRLLAEAYSLWSTQVKLHHITSPLCEGLLRCFHLSICHRS